jgi:hypothetical protein
MLRVVADLQGMDDEGVLVVPTTFATPAVVTWTPHAGTTWRLIPDQNVVVEDEEGYVCNGTVMSVTDNRLEIQLDLATWRPALDPLLTGEMAWHLELASAR